MDLIDEATTVGNAEASNLNDTEEIVEDDNHGSMVTIENTTEENLATKIKRHGDVTETFASCQKSEPDVPVSIEKEVSKLQLEAGREKRIWGKIQEVKGAAKHDSCISTRKSPEGFDVVFKRGGVTKEGLEFHDQTLAEKQAHARYSHGDEINVFGMTNENSLSELIDEHQVLNELETAGAFGIAHKSTKNALVSMKSSQNPLSLFSSLALSKLVSRLPCSVRANLIKGHVSCEEKRGAYSS